MYVITYYSYIKDDKENFALLCIILLLLLLHKKKSNNEGQTTIIKITEKREKKVKNKTV